MANLKDGLFNSFLLINVAGNHNLLRGVVYLYIYFCLREHLRILQKCGAK